MYLPTLLLWMDSIALIPSSTHSMEPLQLAFYVLQADCLQVGEVVHYSSCSLILGWVIYHFNTQILMIVFSPFQKRGKKRKKKSPSSAGVIVRVLLKEMFSWLGNYDLSWGPQESSSVAYLCYHETDEARMKWVSFDCVLLGRGRAQRRWHNPDSGKLLEMNLWWGMLCLFLSHLDKFFCFHMMIYIKMISGQQLEQNM